MRDEKVAMIENIKDIFTETKTERPVKIIVIENHSPTSL